MSDWDQFIEAVPWFVAPNADVFVGPPATGSRGPVDGLPRLSRLLESTTVTPVSVDGRSLELFVWGPPGSRRGWIGPAALRDPPRSLHPVHTAVLRTFGGIVDYFNEPVSWWNNQTEVLTVTAAELAVADVLSDYSWLWEDAGLAVPIDPAGYYVAAIEANGNLTLIRRDNGELLLFAPDHAFDGVTALAGSPPYSLMTIDEAPNLARWIELCADAWLAD